jgi:hypothetical protein
VQQLATCADVCDMTHPSALCDNWQPAVGHSTPWRGARLEGPNCERAQLQGACALQASAAFALEGGCYER